MFKCRSLGMSAKRMLYEGIVVLTALYGAETWNMGAAERRRWNAVQVIIFLPTYLPLLSSLWAAPETATDPSQSLYQYRGTCLS